MKIIKTPDKAILSHDEIISVLVNHFEKVLGRKVDDKTLTFGVGRPNFNGKDEYSVSVQFDGAQNEQRNS